MTDPAKHSPFSNSSIYHSTSQVPLRCLYVGDVSPVLVKCMCVSASGVVYTLSGVVNVSTCMNVYHYCVM